MALPSLQDLSDALGTLASSALDDYVELARNPVNKVIDVVSAFDLAERGRVRDELDAGNSARSDLYGEQDRLRGRFGGEYDAPSLGSEECFDAMSHEDIKSAVDAMDAEPVRASAEGWARIGSALAEGLSGFSAALAAEIGEGWEGVAADRARSATTEYVATSERLAAAGRLVGTKIDEAATGISQVKATVPPVEGTAPLEWVFNTALPGVGLVKGWVHGVDEAHQQAIGIMKSVYLPVMRRADTFVPVLPRPREVAGPPGGSAPFTPPAGTEIVGGAEGSGPAVVGAPGAGLAAGAGAPPPPGVLAPTGPGGAGDPSGGPGGAEAPGLDRPRPGVADPGASANAPLTNSPSAQEGSSDAWTAPASADGAGGVGAGSGAGSGVGNGAGTGGLGPVGERGGPGPAAGTSYATGGGTNGVAGGGVPVGAGIGGSAGADAVANRAFRGSGPLGSPTGGGIGSAPGTGGAAGAGAAGRPGAMGAGMMPGGARAAGEDDREHETPGYLVNVDNGNTLVGRLPLVAPSVIGG